MRLLPLARTTLHLEILDLCQGAIFAASNQEGTGINTGAGVLE